MTAAVGAGQNTEREALRARIAQIIHDKVCPGSGEPIGNCLPAADAVLASLSVPTPAETGKTCRCEDAADYHHEHPDYEHTMTCCLCGEPWMCPGSLDALAADATPTPAGDREAAPPRREMKPEDCAHALGAYGQQGDLLWACGCPVGEPCDCGADNCHAPPPYVPRPAAPAAPDSEEKP